MKILAIDTSCDDTSIAITEDLKILSNVFWSKVKLHSDFGGVVPSEARRQHDEFLEPVLNECLKIANVKLTDIDYFAVTYGPGLAIALEAGVNFAKNLSKKYNKPLVAVNHMAGHIYSVLARDSNNIPLSNLEDFKFPALALTVSGGHTDLVLIKNHLEFEIIGTKVDDAAGEAFDKVGRMLGFGFPAGKFIEEAAILGDNQAYNFPRPMVNSDTNDFSFSGLKTAVLYEIKKISGEYSAEQIKGKIKMSDTSNKLSTEQINNISASFQNAIVETLVTKCKKAILKYNPKIFIVGGGVIANKKLRNDLKIMCDKILHTIFYYPIPFWLCTDNAAMIAIASFYMVKENKNIYMPKDLKNIDRTPGLKL